MFDFFQDVVDYVFENPVKCFVGGVAVVATGGAVCFVAAPAAATFVGGAGLLGTTATTGTAISSLSGAALTKASLAACGGGALSVGGGGVAGGTMVIAKVGAVASGVGYAGTLAASEKLSK